MFSDSGERFAGQKLQMVLPSLADVAVCVLFMKTRIPLIKAKKSWYVELWITHIVFFKPCRRAMQISTLNAQFDFKTELVEG